MLPFIQDSKKLLFKKKNYINFHDDVETVHFEVFILDFLAKHCTVDYIQSSTGSINLSRSNSSLKYLNIDSN